MGKFSTPVYHLACALILLSLFSASAHSDEFKITRLSTRLVEGSYLMDAEIEYRFSDKVIEALQNGVPLTLEVHVQLREEGAWVWQADLLDVRLRYRIRYQALASLYQVVDLQSKSEQNFATRRAALNALGKLERLPVVRQDQLKPGESYYLSLRSRLDIEQLPLPLRPMAYITPAWNLESEWSRWPLQP